MDMTVTSHTFISCSSKYPGIASKSRNSCSICLKAAGRAGSTGSQRKAPLPSHCSLHSEGEAVHTLKSGLQLLWRPACASVTLHVQHTQTSPSAAHQRNKTSEYWQQTQVLSWFSPAALWFLQLQLCASHASPSLPSLWHPLLSWPQTAIVGTGSFSKA